MISLVEYIKDRQHELETYIDLRQTYKGSFDKYCEINNITNINDVVFEDYYNRFLNYRNKYYRGHTMTYKFDWINEMLQVHDPIKLTKYLNREFCEKHKVMTRIISKIESQNSIKRVRLIVPLEVILNNKEFDKFNDICDTFMWCTREIDKDSINKDKKSIELEIEPIKGDNCTKFVKGQCKGIVYHITQTYNESSIETKGIRPRNNTGKDRFEYNRIYFVCGENWNIAKEGIKDVVKSKFDSTDDIIILKVDVSNLPIEFYRDPTDYTKTNSIFTFISIPPKYIEGKLLYKNLK